MISGLIAAVVLAHCVFAGATGPLPGTCGHVFGQSPALRLDRADDVEGGAWKLHVKPAIVWVGDMTDDGNPNAPIQLEIYSGGSGILRTEYGWFPVTNYAPAKDGMVFDLDADHEVAPNAADRAIVERAAAILSRPAVWNRADDRKCPASATTWSIYCAMQRATREVTGGADHRRPAMEVVRELVDDLSKGRAYNHRLMDYNNDSRTTFADVRSLFADALLRMNDAAWLFAHGFA